MSNHEEGGMDVLYTSNHEERGMYVLYMSNHEGGIGCIVYE